MLTVNHFHTWNLFRLCTGFVSANGIKNPSIDHNIDNILCRFFKKRKLELHLPLVSFEKRNYTRLRHDIKGQFLILHHISVL